MSDRGAESETPTPANVGGQAVFEGVMMRAPGSLAIVCRRRDGSIVIRERSMPALASGPKTWPFLRGMLTLTSALRLGSRSLRWSIDVLEQDLLAEEAAEAAAKEATTSSKPSKLTKKAVVAAPPSLLTLTHMALARVAILAGDDIPLAPVSSKAAAEIDEPAGISTDGKSVDEVDVTGESDAAESEIEKEPSSGAKQKKWPPEPDATVTTGQFVLAPKKEPSKAAAFLPVLFAIVLFLLLPQAAAEGIKSLFKLNLEVTSPGYQVITGLAKLTILITYFSLLRRIPDIRRMFQYHGAEHKAISTYEAGKPLMLEEARPMTALHARCGTTFIIMVAFVSVVLFSLVGAILPPIPGGRLVQSVVFFFLKLPLIPVVTGITFELQRFFARYCSTGPLRALLWPGFLVQKITTADPDDSQLEIALASLVAALTHAKATLSEDHPDRTFASYQVLRDDPVFREAALRPVNGGVSVPASAAAAA